MADGLRITVEIETARAAKNLQTAKQGVKELASAAFDASAPIDVLQKNLEELGDAATTFKNKADAADAAVTVLDTDLHEAGDAAEFLKNKLNETTKTVNDTASA